MARITKFFTEDSKNRSDSAQSTLNSPTKHGISRDSQSALVNEQARPGMAKSSLEMAHLRLKTDSPGMPAERAPGARSREGRACSH